MSDERWSLMRVKRRWVPESVWRKFARQGRGRAVLRWPFRQLLTRGARSPEEAVRWWENQ